MMYQTFNWRCPFCDHNATIASSNFSRGTHEFSHHSKHGSEVIETTVIVCPNQSCRERVLSATLYPMSHPAGRPAVRGSARQTWKLLPSAEMRTFPSYVPPAILADYKEACLIRDLSPKASATLSRRCLQGMIRDFFGVSRARLVEEIAAIQGQIDPATWDAIDAVRKIGNIGAHMEKDINVVVEVDPEEAQLLIQLVETLIMDWYIARHEREQRLARLTKTAADKVAQKSPGSASTDVPV